MPNYSTIEKIGEETKTGFNNQQNNNKIFLIVVLIIAAILLTVKF